MTASAKLQLKYATHTYVSFGPKADFKGVSLQKSLDLKGETLPRRNLRRQPVCGRPAARRMDPQSPTSMKYRSAGSSIGLQRDLSSLFSQSFNPSEASLPLEDSPD